MELIQEMRNEGFFCTRGALVTNDFFCNIQIYLVTGFVSFCVLLCAERFVTSSDWPGLIFKRKKFRTHISTSEILDDVYKPAFPVDCRYKDYFKPTMVTDESGRLCQELTEDLIIAKKTLVKTDDCVH